MSFLSLSVGGAPGVSRAASFFIGRNRFFAKCFSVMPRPFTLASRYVVSSRSGRTIWIVRARGWRSETARTFGPSLAS